MGQWRPKTVKIIVWSNTVTTKLPYPDTQRYLILSISGCVKRPFQDSVTERCSGATRMVSKGINRKGNGFSSTPQLLQNWYLGYYRAGTLSFYRVRHGDCYPQSSDNLY